MYNIKKFLVVVLVYVSGERFLLPDTVDDYNQVFLFR